MQKKKICLISDIPKNDVKTFKFDNFDIAVFNIEGKFYAINRQCTHFKGNLAKGTVKGKTIQCPLHGAVFDLETGKLLKQPGTIAGWFKKGSDNKIYKTIIKDSELFIELPKKIK
ncbi:MAG: Rieske (2Fe-2S) protein [Candidatus Heimdallarchaeota archaeon]|nr:Rieske (2Fe-2S) protein [Candidatus Heimdallarchaeota archaeon]